MQPLASGSPADSNNTGLMNPLAAWSNISGPRLILIQAWFLVDMSFIYVTYKLPGPQELPWCWAPCAVSPMRQCNRQTEEGDNMWEQARRSHCTRAAPGLVGEVFRMDALKIPGLSNFSVQCAWGHILTFLQCSHRDSVSESVNDLIRMCVSLAKGLAGFDVKYVGKKYPSEQGWITKQAKWAIVPSGPINKNVQGLRC